MSLCTSCRLALRRTSLHTSRTITTTSTKPSKGAAAILNTPTWSIRSLLPSNATSAPESISPAQLHHLLRLSALPLPRTAVEEASMISTLQSQLQFVRAVQRVDTTGVEPLRAIRDETEDAVRENTVDLGDLLDVLASEVLVGHYQRPRRVKERVVEEAENWDALGTASRTQGRYFVVKSAKKEGADS